jgi:hypothetical protein
MKTLQMPTAAEQVRARGKKVEADPAIVEQFIALCAAKEGSTLYAVNGNDRRWKSKGEIAHWSEQDATRTNYIDWELTVRTTWSGMLRTVTTRIEERRHTHGDHTCRTYYSAARVI